MFTYRKFTSTLSSFIIIFSLMLTGFQPVSAHGEDGLKRQVNSASRERVSQNQAVTPTEMSLPIENPIFGPALVDVVAPVSTDSFARADISSPNGITLPSTTWYVATSGNNANVCNLSSTPCATIQQAITLASNGDTIWVAEGIYTNSAGNEEVVRINKDVNLFGGWNGTFDSQAGFSIIDGQNLWGAIALGVANEGVTTEIERFIVRNGVGAGIWSGYVFYTDINQLTLRNSTVINNSGYGIYVMGALKLSNVTISNNLSGGVHHDSTGINDTATINNATIVNNTGRGLYTTSRIYLQNTILSGNNFNGNPINCTALYGGVIESNGYNIIDNTFGCSLSATTGDKFNVDPHISTLLPELGYHPLFSNSPAIDAGNNSTCVGTTDQRGVARFDGNGDSIITCDIGAFEYVTPGIASQIVHVSGNNQHSTPNSAFPIPLKVAATDNQGNPVSGVSITFTAPSSGPSGTFADTNTNTADPVITGLDGIATAPQFTANGELGSYNVLASSIESTAVFNFENVLWYVAPGGNDSSDCKNVLSPCATINGALQKSFSGNKILVAQGTYFDDLIWLKKNITISGGWDAGTFTTQSEFSTIDGQNDHQVIQIDLGNTVELERFIITNGYALNMSYGGGIANNGSLMLENAIVKNSWASGGGGGIGNSGSLSLINTSVINNSTNNSGGGIHNTGSLTMLNSTIGENSALYSGGGIVTDGGSILLNFTTISGNSAPTGGGNKNNIQELSTFKTPFWLAMSQPNLVQIVVELSHQTVIIL